ncbi:heat shock protein GrpE related protein [Thermoplasma acidophilum]|uniref:Protein GrpE n=1 Tax=Thermoplasma acidophilum (strain ATCC 25905 / DSM 1728 / JCM 9062 / NBRC 15155 / AMRC-C165) TaxID=273075 RepID=GRPE_THEAC|nr:nucleotide exchange factor GrpE [Thermoplasma acidophilum]Q9HJ84.1 RecName: Full=Protein GrpE; AltName: Full=HSP-70 cofactor [Thermoplasma acidophilum DSM 1728]MCY0851819.1 nucleotide exchange factor GrpE [Thermoplasma acidophilum]CAC12214.1 heat shock protein GrpE related protein [Thermoplasma acidophilum]
MQPTPSEYARTPVRIEMQRSKERNSMVYKEMYNDAQRKYSEALDRISKLTDAYLREKAEVENFIKIKDREVEMSKKNANEKLLKDFLPVLDSIDAAIQAEKDNNLIRIRDQMLGVLSRYGLKPIKAEGSKFDPYLHEVVGVTADGEDGMVKYEVQRGYTLNDGVLRTSKVIVVKR